MVYNVYDSLLLLVVAYSGYRIHSDGGVPVTLTLMLVIFVMVIFMNVVSSNKWTTIVQIAIALMIGILVKETRASAPKHRK